LGSFAPFGTGQPIALIRRSLLRNIRHVLTISFVSACLVLDPAHVAAPHALDY
jgi:hypothetical protein